MSPFSAAARGLGRAAGVGRVVLGAWLLNLLVALPAGLWMYEALRGRIGAGTVAEELVAGLDMGWVSELPEEGVLGTFGPTVLGPGPVLDALDGWLSGDLFLLPLPLLALGLLYGLGWMTLVAGALDHFARPRGIPTLRSRLAAGAGYLGRWLRLVLVAAVAYLLVYRFAHWLFPWIERLTVDVTEERRALAAHLAGGALVVGLLVLVSLVTDYAKIAIVVEKRRSALLALLRGARFVAGRPVATVVLYGGMSVLGLAAAAGYALVVPGAGAAGIGGALAAFVLGQLLLVARLGLRLALFGAESALFERGAERSVI